MKEHRLYLSVVVLSGAIGLTAGPTWSQEKPGSQPGGDKPGISQKGDSRTGNKMGSEQGKTQGDAGEKMSGSGDAGAPKYSKETIKEVQEALKDKGHNPGSLDGVMGPETQLALREFQKKNNLKPTGNLNEETAQKLGVSLNESTTGAKSETEGSGISKDKGTGAKSSERERSGAGAGSKNK